MDCVHTVLVRRRLVVEWRAAWRCMVYDGGFVGCERVVGWERGGMRAGLGCERVGCRRCGGGEAVTVWWFDGM